MSFASERQAHLQALVDTHFSATSSASNYTACRTFPQVKAALQAPRDRTDTQDDANALVRLVGLALQDLLQQGLLLQEEVDYWSRIEESTTQRSSYLLQSVHFVYLVTFNTKVFNVCSCT